MAGSQDSEKRQLGQGCIVRREGPVQGQVPGEKCSRTRCWGGGGGGGRVCQHSARMSEGGGGRSEGGGGEVSANESAS